MRKLGRSWWIAGIAGVVALTTAGGPALAATGPGGFSLRPVYQADDFAHGQAMDILPAGENGLVNAGPVHAVRATGQRPPHSQDQLAPYENLEFGYPSLTDATLSQYYLDESFGVPPGQIIAHRAPLAGGARGDLPRPPRHPAHLRGHRPRRWRSAPGTPRPRTGCSSWTCCGTTGRAR